MDWMTTVIGIGSFLVAAVVLFLISAFSFKERTYEEALAEQHKFAESLWKGDKGNKEKKTKKGAKKSKEKDRGNVDGSNQPPGDAVTEEKPHVEFEPDAEIIPEEQPQGDKEKKKHEKKEKVKPILRNRDSHSPVPAEAIVAELSFDPDVNSANHFIENPPKDAVELKTKEKHKSKGTKGVDISDPDSLEPIVQKENAFLVGRVTANTSTSAPQQQQQPLTSIQPQGTPKKHQRKKGSTGKSDSLDAVDAGEELLMQLGGSEKLLSAIRRVPLSASDLQTMIEVLLNRQQEANDAVESEWIERGGRLDPMSSLKRQLAEKEKALQEQQEVAQVYQNKLRSLGSEISTERTRATQARKQLEETINRQSSEIQLLNARLQQTSEQHAAEITALRNSLQNAQKAVQSTEEHIRQQQRFQEEKNQLENRCAMIHQEFTTRVQQLEDMVRHKEQQLRDCDVKLQNAMAAAVAENEQIKTALKLESSQAQRELAKLRETLNASETQSLLAVHEAHARCEEIERSKKVLEERFNCVDKELIDERNRFGQIERELNNEIHRLREQTKELVNELHKSQQRLQHEQEAAVGNLQSQLNKLQEEVENQKRKNNELREKNYAAMDALAATEKSLLEFKKAKANEVSSQEIKETLQQAVQRIFPDTNLDVQLNIQSFLLNLETKIGVALEKFQKEEQSRAQNQVLHYKTVLSQTEELLNRLQNRVESEEKTWKAKLLDLENELTSSKQERDFWMQQCQHFESDQQSNKEENRSLRETLHVYQMEKDKLLKELENERCAASELKVLLENEKSILLTTQETLEQEKLTVQVLKQQVEQFKQVDSATKTGISTANTNGMALPAEDEKDNAATTS